MAIDRIPGSNVDPDGREIQLYITRCRAPTIVFITFGFFVMKTKQRKDLDSLRGIAILSVVLFHLNTTYFTNGHFGVDIFFVLSGYFIFTSHCVQPERPLYEFFAKRIWRIFPAYFAFLSGIALVTYFILIPGDFVYFVEELRKTACFVSNFQFESKMGYWDTLSENYFVLHTWSLSAEVQFYVCSAGIAVFLKKAGIKGAAFLIAASLASHSFVSENVAFYSLPCRIWQFLFGFIAIHVQQNQILNSPRRHSSAPDRNQNENNEIERIIVDEKEGVEEGKVKKLFQQPFDYQKTASALIILFICLVLNLDRFILAQRILVTLLACYIVASDSSDFHFLDLIWNNKFMRFFGEISYSWYLWHWPIAVLFSYFEADIANPINLLIYLIIPLSLASLSTYLMEKQLLRMEHKKAATVLLAIVPSLIFLIGASLFLFSTHSNRGSYFTNETSRYNPSDPEMLRLHHKWYHCYFTGPCTMGNNLTFQKTTHIWGDSHGMIGFLAHSFLPHILNTTKVTAFIRMGCPPYHACKYENPACKVDQAPGYGWLKEMKPKRVVLMSRYIVTLRKIQKEILDPVEVRIVFEECMMSTVREILKMGIEEIVMVHGIPQSENNVPQYLEKSLKFNWDLNAMHTERHKHEQDTAILREAFENIKKKCTTCLLLDPTPVLCDKKICPVFTRESNNSVRPLYRDEQHLNGYGMEKLAPMFAKLEDTGTWWDIIR